MVTFLHIYKIATEGFLVLLQVSKHTLGEIRGYNWRVLAMCLANGKSVHFLPFIRAVRNLIQAYFK